MRSLHKPDISKSQLVRGIVRQVRLEEYKAILIIEDEDEDGDLVEVVVSPKLFQGINVRDLEEARIICATNYQQVILEDGSCVRDLQILHLSSGTLVGRTLVHKSR